MLRDNFLNLSLGNKCIPTNPSSLGCSMAPGMIEDTNSLFGMGYQMPGRFGYPYMGCCERDSHSVLAGVLGFALGVFTGRASAKKAEAAKQQCAQQQPCAQQTQPYAQSQPYGVAPQLPGAPGQAMPYGYPPSLFGIDTPLLMPPLSFPGMPQIANPSNGTKPNGTGAQVKPGHTIKTDNAGNKLESYLDDKGNTITESHDPAGVLFEKRIDYKNSPNHPFEIQHYSKMQGTEYVPGEEVKTDDNGYKVKTFTKDGKTYTQTIRNGFLITKDEKGKTSKQPIDETKSIPYVEKPDKGEETTTENQSTDGDKPVGSGRRHRAKGGHGSSSTAGSGAKEGAILWQGGDPNSEYTYIFAGKDGKTADKKIIYKKNDDGRTDGSVTTYEYSGYHADGEYFDHLTKILPDKTKKEYVGKGKDKYEDAQQTHGKVASAGEQQTEDYTQIPTSKEYAIYEKLQADKKIIEDSKSHSTQSGQDTYYTVISTSGAPITQITPYGRNPKMAEDLKRLEASVRQEEQNYRYLVDKIKPQYNQAFAAYDTANKLLKADPSNQDYQNEYNKSLDALKAIRQQLI